MTMTTPDPTQRQAWRALIHELAEEAKRTMPEMAGRIDKAVSLILLGDVDLLDDGSALVGSQTHGDRTYTVVNQCCNCPDMLRAPAQRCKHLLAVELMHQALDRQPPSSEDAGPETPAPRAYSLTFAALVADIEVELTLRAPTADALLRQLDTVLRRQRLRPLAMLDPHAA
jgi:hypothetical protein